MRRILTALALLPLAAGAAAADRVSPEAELARAVEGRVAGAPVECIDARRFTSSRIVDGLAIVYSRTGGTVYVNRPDGAGALDDWEALLVRQFGSRLCRGDVVTIFDPNTMRESGTVVLGEFVPYERARR